MGNNGRPAGICACHGMDCIIVISYHSVAFSFSFDSIFFHSVCAVVLNPENFSLVEFVKPISDTFLVRAHAKNVEFRTIMDANVPTTLYTDRNRLRQIIINLLVTTQTKQQAITHTQTTPRAAKECSAVQCSGASKDCSCMLCCVGLDCMLCVIYICVIACWCNVVVRFPSLDVCDDVCYVYVYVG